ncbi:hypothetical protein BD289DRAFT_348580, partial [Coniella lustricola]
SRLHIAPLDPSLLKVIVPAAVLPKARHISYHTVQTFPDRPYGFVELPTADADKIKNKLNGAVLKGSKIKVELARPDDMPKPISETVEDSSKKSKRDKKDKKDRKRKRDPNEIVGVELEEGRKVRRGWTVTPEEAQAQKEKEQREERRQRKSKKADKEAKDLKAIKKERKEKDKKQKRKAPESIYSAVPECLVKTQVPPNKLDVVDPTGEKRKSKKNKAREVVVHEFEKNTKFPTFLKASAVAAPSEKEHTTFVEGKGWVDDSGKIVEEIKSTRPTAFPKMVVVEQTQITKPQEPVNDDTSSSEDETSSEEESEDEEEKDEGKDEAQSQSAPPTTLSLDTESATARQSPPAIASTTEANSAVPESASSPKSLTIRIPPATPTSGPSEVHPLEALYKRAKEDQAAVTTETAQAEGFSFFGGLGEDDDQEDGMDVEADDMGTEQASDDGHLEEFRQASQAPMTPYTEQDMEWRNLRSAAPTPDTAHPSRIARFWPIKGENPFGSSSLQEEDEDDNEDAAKGASDPNTDFQGWFWEHRGDLNRSWKKRRKLAAKEKRYRDNKARAARAI